jgi:hypothetical protein
MKRRKRIGTCEGYRAEPTLYYVFNTTIIIARYNVKKKI